MAKLATTADAPSERKNFDFTLFLLMREGGRGKREEGRGKREED
jgi:hypothetical protein